jgi:DNA-binding NtrC family response regulator
MKKLTALCLEGREPENLNLDSLVRSCGCEVFTCNPETLLQSFQTRNPRLVIVGSRQGIAWEGVELARKIRRIDQHVPIILLTADSSEELAIAALKAGVNDYFSQPISLERLLAGIKQCLDSLPDQEAMPLEPLKGRELISASPSVAKIKDYIRKIASQDSTVLVTGETGTGKELVAEMIYLNSGRRHQPFVSVNCASIPDSLFESELFGYERGAFTGAVGSKPGKLEQANGGTILLDEIGDLSLCAQAKLLRVIETKETCRLGGRKDIKLDVRIIAATNCDLERLMAEGRFREDLFFRLNVGRIHLPPLRDRKEDIPLLLDHYLSAMNCKFGFHVQGFTPEARAYLTDYDWPGNVRELRNLLEATFINQPPAWIRLQDLPEPFKRRLSETKELPDRERERLIAALYETNWNKTQAAQSLNWSRMTLYRKMSKYNLLTKDKTAPANEQGEIRSQLQ